MPGLCREHLDRLDELWQVGPGLPPLQHQRPERGRDDLPAGGHRHRGHAGRRHRHPIAGQPLDQRRQIHPRCAAAGRRRPPPDLGKTRGPAAEPAALPAGILPLCPRPQLWPGDGSAPRHGGSDEPLGRGHPARRGGLRHGGQRHPEHRQRRLCSGCRGLLRLSLLAGLDGPAGPAHPDPRRLPRCRPGRAPHPGSA